MTAERPFAPSHSRESFVETRSGREILDRLGDGLGAREPFLLLTGEPGTGKTALVHEALARWGSRVTAAVLAFPALAGCELLEEIVRRFGVEPPEGASRSRLVACFESVVAEIAGRGQVAVLVVDDAHDLPAELLEELRLLVNAALQASRPIEVLLVGLPALEARLADPALPALGQRVSVRASTTALSSAETLRYLHHRVTAVGGDGPGLFSRRTSREIAALAHGVPRRIDALAGEALRLTRAAGQPTVSPEQVRAAALALWGAAAASRATAASDADPAGAPPARSERRPDGKGRASTAAAAGAPAVASAAAPPVAPGIVTVAAPLAQPASGPAVIPAAGTRHDDAAAPRHVPPAPQDAKEWVARFVGSSGPLQISSRAFVESKWAPEPSDAPALESAPTPTAPEVESAPIPAASKGPRPRRARLLRAPSRSRRGRRAHVPAAAALIAIVAVVAVGAILRWGGCARRAARAAGSATTPMAPGVQAPGAVAAAAAGSGAPLVTRVVRAAPRADQRGATSLSPKPGAARAPAGGPGAASPASLEADDQRRYTIDVGAYLDLERALLNRDRLRSRMRIEGWVVTSGTGGEESHRIVLGVFRTPERATAAAHVLLADDAVTEAQVIPLPPRRLRR